MTDSTNTDARCDFCEVEGYSDQMVESDTGEVMCDDCQSDYTLEEQLGMGFDHMCD